MPASRYTNQRKLELVRAFEAADFGDKKVIASELNVPISTLGLWKRLRDAGRLRCSCSGDPRDRGAERCEHEAPR